MAKAVTPAELAAWMTEHQASVSDAAAHFEIPAGTAKWLARRAKSTSSSAAAAAGVELQDIPVIRLGADLFRVVDEAQAALRADPELFQQAGRLVQVAVDADGRGRVAPVNVHALRVHLSTVARWEKHDADDVREVAPPLDVAHQVLATCAWPGVRVLAGVVQEPILRPDGEVLQIAGWDSETHVVYAPIGAFGQIPDHPSLEDARRSVAELLEVVADFPFADDAARMAWLASALTPFARYAFDGAAPLFLVEANCRGTGKSKLATVAGMIALGRPPAAAAAPDSDDEMRKRITSYALEGRRVVLLDNVVGALGWPSLDAVLTTGQHGDRLLGGNLSLDVEMRATWWATANNAELSGDVSRRLLPIRLVSPMARPELREDFRHPDLLAHVRELRPRLVVAALTLLRAYIAAGRPAVKMAPWGSFEAWSRWVRAPIVWATGVDPAAAREAIEERDEMSTLHARLVEAVKSSMGTSSWTVAELCGKVDTWRSSGWGGQVMAELEAVLLELSRARDQRIVPMTVGKRLNLFRDRVAPSGWALVEAGHTRLHIRAWRVEQVDAEGGDEA